MSDQWQTTNSTYGGWFGACLPPMISTKRHTPKVNDSGAEKVRTPKVVVDKARKNLQETLDVYCLKERVVEGDGNCQFRALSDQLYHEQDQHRAVRQSIVEQLQMGADKYRDYVPQDYKSYVTGMSQDGCWGDHVTLQACADRYGMPIYLITSYDTDNVIQVVPETTTSDSALWLSFWAEIHYNSIVPKSIP
mmetsp:Transcript_12293/g.14691  ORF Transcript_12293/g.14691 Transcript_12293/m.14691 type:complete len:192 (+) Transcript_12293:95-670(+)